MNDVHLGPLEERLASILENGREPALSDLGGLEALRQGADEIALSPLLPEFIRLLLAATASDEKDRESILDLTLRLLVHVRSLDMDEVIDAILSSRHLSNLQEKQFFHNLLEISFNHDRDPLCRSFALDGALRLVGDQIPRRHTILAKLTEVEHSDDPIFLRHAAKIIGIAFTWWQSDGLVDRLKDIVRIEGADDEAAFELGMASLVEGVIAQDVGIVQVKLNEAQEWFRSAIEKREHRPDAALYVAAIQSWLDFAQGSSSGNLSNLISEINQELLTLYAWHHSQHSPPWLGARFSEQASWRLLTGRLASFVGRLGKPSWFDARLVIEQELIGIITASRTIRETNWKGGLELLAVPRIISGINGNPGLIQHLRDWVENTPEHPHAISVKDLLKNVKSVQPSNDEDHKGIGGRAMAALYDIVSGPSPSKMEYQLLEECSDVLKDADDYADSQQRDIFNAILLLAFRYLISRMDLTIKNAPYLSFLLKPEKGSNLPTEDKLQQDFHSFLIGLVNSGNTQAEAWDIAAGRADITVTAGGYRFVTEIKREIQDASFDNLRLSFANQTVEYQNTGIRLGILLVLDLTEKSPGVAHVDEQVQACVVQRPNQRSKRGVVIIRVPGNKIRPSDLTALAHKK
ncbi:MAG: hypothetical protein HQL55_12995 [Magnetococcales bacterium]|nr:hypothetical protein [Magnetococcales bacterium]